MEHPMEQNEVTCGTGKDVPGGVEEESVGELDQPAQEGQCPINVPPLPEGWVEVVHSSGGTIYFNTADRTCTWSRPYQVSLNKKVKQHSPPLSSIPCLQQLILSGRAAQGDTGADEVVKRWLSEVKENKAKLSRINPRRLREYLGLHWPLSSTSVEKTGSDDTIRDSRTTHDGNVDTKEKDGVEIKKNLKPVSSEDIQDKVSNKDQDGSGPVLPDHLRKCISQQTGKKAPRVLSVKGDNSPLSLLYHLTQAYLKAKVDIITSESDDDTLPYAACMYVNGMYHGSGRGNTKRQAKHNAGSFVVDLLLKTRFSDTEKGLSEQECSLKLLGIQDSLRDLPINSPEALSKLSDANLPSPWTVLNQCVSKSEIVLQEKVSFTTSKCTDGGTQYCMSVGEGYQVEGTCQKIRNERNIASQTMLQKLYPYFSNWLSLMCVYDDIVRGRKRNHKTSSSGDSPPSKRPKHSLPGPNTVLLDKLKAEMSSLSKEIHSPPSLYKWKERLLI